MAEGRGIWKTGVSGNHDGLLESAHRYPLARPEFCDPEDGGGHRCGGTESPAVSGTASFCP